MRKIKLLLISIFIITNVSIVNAQSVYTGVFKTTTNNTDYHHFTRSNATGSAVYINQVSTGPILRLSSGIFDANQNVKFTVENNGYVGIGTTTPEYVLDVQSVSRINNVFIGTSSPASGITIRANFPGYTGGWARGFYIANENGSEKYFGLGSYGSSTDGVANLNYSYIGKAYNDAFMYFKTNGNIGIGTASPLGKVDILAATDEVALRLSMPTNEDAAAYDIKWANSNADVVHRIQYSGSYYDFMNVNRATCNVSFNGGNVAIGTTTIPTGYKLAVDGKVICEEVKVEMSDQWADFVFEPTYNLMPLKELDTFIQENKHLPEIPTTADVQENGISVGEMNAKLLQKIEELTLYVIDLQKQVDNQDKIIKKLSEK